MNKYFLWYLFTYEIVKLPMFYMALCVDQGVDRAKEFQNRGGGMGGGGVDGVVIFPTTFLFFNLV